MAIKWVMKPDQSVPKRAGENAMIDGLFLAKHFCTAHGGQKRGNLYEENRSAHTNLTIHVNVYLVSQKDDDVVDHPLSQQVFCLADFAGSDPNRISLGAFSLRQMSGGFTKLSQ